MYRRMELQMPEAIGIKCGRLDRIKPETRQGYILLCALLWSTIVFLLVQHFVLSTVVVVGQSMMPALKPGDCCLVNCWLPLFRDYHRGDIVVVRDQNSSDLLVKRIVGLPSDRVQIHSGQVYVNSHSLREDYLPSQIYTAPGKLGRHTYQVAKDCYFVLGDNRSASDDSRFYGAVHRADLLGLVSQ